MKQSRFNDDHHNTQSIAQLLNNKMISNPPTVRTNLSKMGQSTVPNSEEKPNLHRESLEDESLLNRESGDIDNEKEIESEGEGEGKQGQNYDDYVLGQKIDEDDDSNDNKHVHKKYAEGSLPKSLSGYIPRTES